MKSDENSLWRWKQTVISRDLLNFQLRELQFIFILFPAEKSPAAGRQKIVNLYNLMDRLMQRGGGEEEGLKNAPTSRSVSIYLYVCESFSLTFYALLCFFSIKLTFQTRLERK